MIWRWFYSAELLFVYLSMLSTPKEETLSILRSFTSFWIQVVAVVVVLVGIAVLLQAVHPDAPSWYTVAVASWAAFAALLTMLLLRRTKPLRYLFALLYAVADWLGGFWERLSYFVTAAGLFYGVTYLEQLHNNHYWTDPAWWVYVVGGGIIAISLAIYGLLQGHSFEIEYDDGQVRDFEPISEFLIASGLSQR